MKRGKFITLEGGDGAGKTTLLEKIVRSLRQEDLEWVVTREPGSTPLGESVRDLLLEKSQIFSVSPKAEMLLFLAARAQHLQEVVLPALDQGKLVLCDRFNDSTIAYQGAGRGLGVEYVEHFCQTLCGEAEPDLTIFLDLDPAIGKGRLSARLDRLEQEENSFHERVRQGFRTLAQKHPQRIHVIDATQSAEAVFQLVFPLILSTLKIHR